MGGTHPRTMSEGPGSYIHQHDRTHLLSSVETLSTYNHQHGRTHLLPSVKRHSTYNHQHGRTHLLPSVKRNNTYIWPWKELNPLTMSKGHSVPDWGFLITDQVPPFSQIMETTLIFDQVGTHPSITSEWPCTHIWSCENTSHSHIRMALVLDWVFLVTSHVPPFKEWK